MKTPNVQLSNVVYNAAEQSFEARATVYGADGARIYPCAIEAPITMSFEGAAAGLATQALRRHRSRNGLRACILPPAPQAVRPVRRTRRFDAFQMLRRLAA